MKANSKKTKQSKKATRRVLAGVLCGASVLSLVLSLVMPPISQAIANDVQTVPTEKTVTEDSSTESTDVENTNNGDTENQNSDDVEGGETNPTNDVEQNQAEDQLEDEQRGEDGESSDGNAVMAVAEGGQTEAASGGIDSADTLKTKLESASGTANFELTKDIDTKTTIQLGQDGSNITLDLKGHKIKHTSQRDPLFNITGGATLIIKDTDPKKPSESVDDGKQLNDQDQTLDRNNYGREAELVYDTDGIPSSLTYYVTESSPSKKDTTKTTEMLFKHSVEIKGAIVACDGSDGLRLINLYATNSKGGTFKLESGVITQQENTQQKQCRVDSLVYAENGSTVNMSGGYVCGAFGSHAGGGIEICNNSSLDVSGGVIAGNSAYSGGGVSANASTVTITNGVISGNSTLDSVGFGGGIMAEYGGSVTVFGGYITNNRYAKFCGKDGDGCHGGAGLAAIKGADVAIYGGQITGNYSDEAGGGVYVTNIDQQDMAWLKVTGGIIASNVSYRSEGAGIRVGQKVDAFINGPKESNGTKKSIVYITNNHCMSRYDWGGGGIFVQGDSKNATNAGRLFVYNSYISSNIAGGYGGGVAVCPSGKTLVTNTEGTAIFGNSSAGADYHDKKYPDPAYDKEHNSGNDKAPHLSKGGDGKNQDYTAYLEQVFRDNGHADFFLAAHDNNKSIAVVTGKMLGGGDARYSGSIELKKAITIPANGAVGVENSIGLTSGVIAEDEAAIDARNHAQNEATTFITGNYSWDHGGGIMSNGDLYLGVPADAYVYPSLKLKATKELAGRTLGDGDFKFTVYRKNSDTAKAPSWKNDKFDKGGCELVKSAQNSADGHIAFDLSDKLELLLNDKQLGEQLLAKGAVEITYYLVEDGGNKPGVHYDRAVYEIKVRVKYNKTVLMSVPIQGNSNSTRELNVHNYTIDSVHVTKHDEGSAKDLGTVPPGTDGYYSIVDSSSATSTNKATFTNTYDPEVSWTPRATKVVEGGEMKEFTLQLAKDSEFKNIIGTAVTSGSEKTQTLPFMDENNEKIELKYSLSDIRNNPGDPGGPFKTFTYYVREKTDGPQFSHYTYDQSVYQFTVEPTYDTEKGEINCRVTYKKGTVDSAGNWAADPKAEKRTFIDTFAPNSTDTSIPTFTNTYSTSLPLSGMSGVTLTYIAGAAVLCAAAAWMHIRRKANAKGGERRE